MLLERNDAIEHENHSNLGMRKMPVETKTPGETVREHDELPVLLLNEEGLIQDCNKPVEKLFGFRLSELVWQHISCLFPQLAELALIQKGQINPKLHFISHCGHIFLGLNKQGTPVPNELSFIRLDHHGSGTLRLILCPV